MLHGRQIVCLSSLPWHGRPTSRHHLASILAETNDVLFVDPPRNVVRAAASHRGRLVREETVHRLEPPPHLPFGGSLRFRLSTPANQRRYQRAVSSAADALGWRRPVLWTVFPVYPSVAVGERLAPSVHVLHLTDSLWDLPQYRPEYEGFLRRILATVDVAVATTEAIAARLSDYVSPVHLLPHGVDVDRFRDATPTAKAASVAGAAPIIGFAGQLDHRLDVELVEALAKGPGTVVLVGPSRLGAAEESRLADAGCVLVGEVPYADLPGWVAAFDVAVLPYRLSPFVLASRPLKLLEYLAAGVPVVSVDIPAARQLAPHVAVAAAGELPVAVLDAARTATDEALRRARIAAAATSTWRQRAEELSELVEGAERAQR